MGPLEEDELRRLRARAYGPAADIDRDPSAMARLAELETVAGTGAGQDVPALGSDRVKPPRSHPAPHRADRVTDAPPSEAVAPHADGDAVSSASSPDRRRRPRWLVPGLWAASLAVTAIIAAIVTSTASVPPVTAPEGGTPVALLAPDPGFSSDVFGTRGYGAQGFENFHGLTPIVTDGRSASSFGTDSCLIIVPSGVAAGDDSIYTGRWRTGCAAGPIPASVAMDLDSTVPAETSAAYPDSVLLFVYDDDLVRVYEYPAM